MEKKGGASTGSARTGVWLARKRDFSRVDASAATAHEIRKIRAGAGSWDKTERDQNISSARRTRLGGRSTDADFWKALPG